MARDRLIRAKVLLRVAQSFLVGRKELRVTKELTNLSSSLLSIIKENISIQAKHRKSPTKKGRQNHLDIHE